MRSVADAAYMAGFLDGEGTVTASKYGDAISLQLSVVNTCLPTLKGLQKIWGGSWHVKNKNKKPQHKLVYALKWSSYKSLEILQEIQPYLRNKERHCVVALQFQSTMPPKRWDKAGLSQEEKMKRLVLYTQLKELNQRGVHE